MNRFKKHLAKIKEKWILSYSAQKMFVKPKNATTAKHQDRSGD